MAVPRIPDMGAKLLYASAGFCRCLFRLLGRAPKGAWGEVEDDVVRVSFVHEIWVDVEEGGVRSVDAVKLLEVAKDGDFGLFEHLLKTCGDVEYALTLFIQFLPLLHEGLMAHAWVTDEGEAHVCIELRERSPQSLQMALFAISLWERLVRPMAGDKVLFRQIWVPEDLGVLREVVEKRLGCCVLASNRDDLGFVLQTDQFKKQTANEPTKINLFLLAQAEEKLTHVKSKYSFQTRLYSLVREQLLQGKRVTLRDMSRAMGMSPRTLQRKLSQKELFFKDLIEIARREIIENLMSRGEGELLQNREVVSKLGYQSTTSLYRLRERMSIGVKKEFGEC
ncbi:AraC family transcriptional regulator [bacterium]|nr:AraC family transcriptional regulator [bacterium]